MNSNRYSYELTIPWYGEVYKKLSILFGPPSFGNRPGRWNLFRFKEKTYTKSD